MLLATLLLTLTAQTARAAEYEIYTLEELREFMLTVHVEDCAGDVIRLMADIDCEGGRFNTGDPEYPSTFCGTFDGQGHKIYNFVNTPTGSSQGGYGAAMFDFAENGATIKDLTLEGSLPGTCSGAYSAAFVLAVESPSGLTLDNCHFNGSVTNVYHSAALVGFASSGTGIGEVPSIILNNCSANATITSTGEYIAGGLVAKGMGVKAYDCSFKGKVTSLGTVGGLIGVAINCELENCFEGGYTYIDENSNNVYSTDYYTVLDNTMTTISAGWYVVNSDVTFNGDLSTNVSSWADNTVNIILCDGATLTANNIEPNGNRDILCIYGQSQSTGTANISGSIEASSSLQIYGGTINAAGNIVCAQSGVGIYGGNVTAADINGHEGSLSLTGGTITASSLTVDQGDIELGGATVTAGSYNVTQGNVTILPGITYYDGTGASYTAGDLSADQISAIAGKTLRTHDYRGGDIGNENNVTWAVIDTDNNGTYETLTISGTGTMADYSLTNRPWVNYLAGIASVVIDNGVTSIGQQAFRNCTSLNSITIPASVESIGSGAFRNCTSLKSVTIPASVTYIGQSAFYGCKLTSITLNEGLTTINEEAFSSNGTTIESVSIPQSVTSIGNNAFNGTSVQNFYINNIPSKIAIGETTPFKESAVSIHVFTLMKSIFENATNWSKYKGHFVDDIEITHVESVTLDNESMIVKTNASGQLNATINPADARVKDVVFTSSNDNLVQITNAATGEFLAGSQNGTATITCTAMDGSGAYATCNVEVKNYFTPAESVTLNKTTNSLDVGGQFKLTATIAPGNATFKNVSWRTSDETVATVNDGTVTAVAPGVATITAISQDGQARANCVVSVIGSCGTDVTWVLTGTSPNYTLTISGTSAISFNPWYNYRADITTVVINNGVTGINMGVFMNTTNLTSVTIPASVTFIRQQAFDGCTNLETVSGCEGVTDVGNDAFSGTKWLTDQPDGVVYIGKVAYLGKNVSGEVNIKAGTVSISSNAFKDCTNLTSITIPNSVTDIGSSAFKGCTSLTSITIPNSVTYIGANAFFGCSILATVTIGSGVENIGKNAFFGCSNLATVTVYAQDCSLGSYAFNSCHEDLQIYVFSDRVGYYQGIWYQYRQIIKGMTGGYCGADDPQTYEDESKNVIWLLSGTSPNYTLTISGTGAMEDYDTPDDQPWKEYRSTITSVVIEDGVTSIGNNAFAYCTGASFNADDLIAQGVTYGENSFNQVGCLVGTLANNADNTEKIALLYQAASANVTLSDRTLYKDGAWNTIVLPFDIADINAKEEEVYTCPLHGATVMELDVDNKWAMVNSEWAIDNEKGTSETGLVDGTLNLFFKPATSIESGKPYIIKWASGSNLENPVFNSVPVFVDNHNATSSDGKVVFKGTYGPVTWNTETKSILFLGDENKLYFPQPSGDDIPHLGAFRAYFELDPTAHVREFNLNFGEETSEATIISPAEIKEIADKADAAWYSLDGRKLDAKPSSKGIYIHGGRKTVIK